MRKIFLGAALACTAAYASAQITPLTATTMSPNSIVIGRVLIAKDSRFGRLTNHQFRVVATIGRKCEGAMLPSEPVRKKLGIKSASPVAVAYCSDLLIGERNRDFGDLRGITAFAPPA